MTEPEKAKSKKQLLAEMQKAMDTGDFKVVSKVSSEIAKLVAVEEKAEKDAKLEAIVGLTEEVKGVILDAINPLIESGQLDACDGVWFSKDFGEKLITCRLLKGAARKGGGGGGGGKKFNITTNELLAKHGDKVIEAGDLAGMTLKEAYEANTNGNSRYKIRMKLLKAEGLS